MNNVNIIVLDIIINSIKYYGYVWGKIASYFFIFHLAINILRSRTINQLIEAFINYPISVFISCVYGSLFGLLYSIHENRIEVLENIDSYFFSLVSILSNQLLDFLKIKILMFY